MSQFNIDEIEKRTLSGLKDFQRATVERVDYLFRHNQNRVLVADEVGMGKTLIARGAIVKTARLRIEEKDDLFKVIYICSNQNIANQNIRKLDVTGKNAIGSVSDTRLSMQHLKITEQENDPQIKEGFIQLIPLTPETSFRMTTGGGSVQERALMYIFSLAMQGKSSIQIARQLHEENVPTIMQMRKPNKEYTDGKVHSWSENSVRRMLNNRFYLGEMAYGKSVRKSVGSKNSISVPMEDWKVIKEHHEALISEEIFEQVSLFRPEHSTKRNREKHPLTGKLYCGGCGYSLNYKPLRGKNRNRRFECRKHALLKIPECCTYMSADLLEETVLLMLNKELMLRGDAVKQNQKLTSFQKSGIASLKRKLENYQSEMKQARAKKDNLYEQYALSGLTKEAYQSDANELAEQITLLSVKIEETAGKLAVMESEYQKAEEDMKQIIRYSHIEKLTQDVVDTFISKVYAYKDKRVEIEWNFSVDRGCRQAKAT